jgi:riboflavin kinase/FMN adenylyltransferase
MKVLRTAEELNPQGRLVCGAIGVFDGVHLGHRRVLVTAVEEAAACSGLSVAVTFAGHPQSILNPDHAPQLILPLSLKLRLLEELGFDAVWLIAFDLRFSRQPAASFVSSMVEAFRPLRSISVGDSFVFGSNRSGNVELLRRHAEASGFAVHAHTAVQVGGEVVSSTRIRECIAAGDLAEASVLLGRPYALAGTVVRGQQLGRRLGFPTANVEVTGLVLPPLGVYAARVRLGGRQIAGVLNLGFRPTVSGGETQRHCEVHLLDFAEDLYGQELEVELVKRLRGEVRFPSLEALKGQIELDVASARRQLLP